MDTILQAALQEGHIPHHDYKFLIHGPGGVGKSSLIAMFLGTQRDLIHISTTVATESLHLTPIRDVSTSTFTADWQRVNYERLSRMIAHTSNQMFICWKNEKKEKKGKSEGADGSALAYLCELNIIAYYDVLPNVIFSSSQVILDKITELVHYSLKLKKGQCPLSGPLESPDFSACFISSYCKSVHYAMCP